MILFLNFAPFRFMGGAEKWVYEVSKKITGNNNQQVTLLSVSSSLASIYSNLVLRRPFEERFSSLNTSLISEVQIDIESLIPFTRKWSLIKDKINSASKVYIKYELLEVLLLWYYGGKKTFSKTIAGIHTPFVYHQTHTLLEKVHNFIYSSKFSNIILSKCYKVHVITHRDEKFFKSKLKLKNVIFIPNSMTIRATVKSKSKSMDLRVLFVGELVYRKGIDIIINMIKRNPNNIRFDIVGNGPYKDEIKKLCLVNKKCIYHDYLNQKTLYSQYAKSDLLILPSRAEGFPLVFLEALAHGLPILTSSAAAVGLPKNMEVSVNSFDGSDYIKAIESIKLNKIKTLKKSEIIDYYKNSIVRSSESNYTDKLFA